MKRAIVILLAGVFALVALSVTQTASARCGIICSGIYKVRHPIKSHLNTGYRCHTARCRYHRYQKGSHSSGSSYHGVGSVDPHVPKHDRYKCVKRWIYNKVPYWHWRYYRFRKLTGVGRNHIGVTHKGPRCWS